MRKSRLRLSAALLGVVALGTAAGASASAKDVTARVAAKPIVVANPNPFSGSSATLGEYSTDAFKLALQEVFPSKAARSRIQIVDGDTQCTPSTAVQAIHQILGKNPVVAMSSNCSGDTLAMEPFLERLKIPMVSNNFSPTVVTNDRYDYNALPTLAQIDTALAKYIAAHHVRKIGIIHDTTAYGESVDASVSSALRASGIKVATDSSYSFSDTNYSGQILAAKKANVQAVYVEGYAEQIAQVIKQLRSLGLKLPVYGSLDIDDPAAFKAGGKALNGVVFGTGYMPSHSAASRRFTKLWKAHFGFVPLAVPDFDYESAMVLLTAVKRAEHNPTPAAINTAIAHTNITLPSGKIRFTSSRERSKPTIYIGKIMNNSQVVIKTS